MNNLRVNFDELISTGNNVKAKAAEFADLLKVIKDNNASLRSDWEGTEASKYTDKVAEQAKIMDDLQVTIEEIGAFLVNAGNRYKEVSEANASRIN